MANKQIDTFIFDIIKVGDIFYPFVKIICG